MGAAGNVVDKKWLVGGCSVEPFDVRDGFVRKVGGEVVAGLSNPRKNLRGVLPQVWRPLIGFAAHETVEIVKAHAARPLVVGPSGAVLVAWRVVVLAKP